MTQKRCPRCDEGDYTRDKREDGLRHACTTKAPSLEELEHMSSDAIAQATDGCDTEPDGICEHGHQSWLLRLHII